jgi:ribosomal protein S12 methylthiotransferase accessory factor
MSSGARRADPARTRSLAESDRLLSAAADRFGVARIAEITRLDRLGIAAVSVTRRDPIGESVSVCTGKGDSVLEARVAALAEALERYCGEPRGRLEIITCPARELTGDAIAPSALIPWSGADLERPIDWCRGARLDGTPLWVPVNAVVFPYLPSPAAERLFAAHTHGLAAGAHRDEAIVHGLLECIERDGYARAVALASTGRGELISVIDPASPGAAASGDLLASICGAGLRVLLRDLTADTTVPAVLCVIDDGALAHMGSAARLDPARALRAAVLEAAQSRVTDLQGAREDLPPRGAPVDPWFVEPGAARVVPWPAPSAPLALDVALASLTARLAAMSPPITPAVVDLSLPGIDVAVVRVIAPGLEAWAHDPSRVGPRAQAWLTRP